MPNKNIVIIGYSGHAFVAIDIFKASNRNILGYCERLAKEINPYDLTFLGNEGSTAGIKAINNNDFFIGIGDNYLRKKITENLVNQLNYQPINAIHPTAIISKTAILEHGIMLAPYAVINACAKIGKGVICNTAAIIEHECVIGNYAHIAPNATLCGNVQIGNHTFIGAGAVVKQGVKIGGNVIVGAGTVVIKDVESHTVIVGNPQKKI